MSRALAEPAAVIPLQPGREIPGELFAAQHLRESRRELRRALQRTPRAARPWAASAHQRLVAMQDALAQHREFARGDHCDYERLCLHAQWMIPRLHKLLAAFDDIEARSLELCAKLERASEGEESLVSETRREGSRLVADLRRALAEENAVEVDSFNEPPALD